MPALMTHHRFTVTEYDRMLEHGILTEDDRVELIRGEIVQKMVIGSLHAGCVNRLTRLMNQSVHEGFIVTSQNPIRLEDSEPEPDLCVCRYRDDFYSEAHPAAEDILLIVEVADSTLEFDRTIKRDLYAEAGIPEYWIVNLPDRCLEVFRSPLGGAYQQKQLIHAGEQLMSDILRQPAEAGWILG